MNQSKTFIIGIMERRLFLDELFSDFEENIILLLTTRLQKNWKFYIFV